MLELEDNLETMWFTTYFSIRKTAKKWRSDLPKRKYLVVSRAEETKQQRILFQVNPDSITCWCRSLGKSLLQENVNTFICLFLE